MKRYAGLMPLPSEFAVEGIPLPVGSVPPIGSVASRSGSGYFWMLLLGDSLMRGVFLELLESLCGVTVLKSHGEYNTINQTIYHHSRTFCVSPNITGHTGTYRSPEGCSYTIAPHRTERSSYHFPNATAAWASRCPQRVKMSDAKLCVSFDWAPWWSDVCGVVSLATSACNESKPDALITNPGTHEVIDEYAHLSQQTARRARRDVSRYLLEIATLLRATGAGQDRQRKRRAMSLVVQSVTAVQPTAVPERKRKELRELTNSHIQLYNGAVRDAMDDATSEAAHHGVCLSLADGYALTSQDATHRLNGTRDGVHWRAPFPRIMATADVARAFSQMLVWNDTCHSESVASEEESLVESIRSRLLSARSPSPPVPVLRDLQPGQ